MTIAFYTGLVLTINIQQAPKYHAAFCMIYLKHFSANNLEATSAICPGSSSPSTYATLLHFKWSYVPVLESEQELEDVHFPEQNSIGTNWQ